MIETPFLLTKIIATLGPASRDAETIGGLIEAGVRVFRINFSHGNLDKHEQALRNVRAASEKLEMPVGVLGDLAGPKIRIGEVAEPGIELAAGDLVEFQGEAVVAGAEGSGEKGRTVLSSSYPPFTNDVAVGQTILLDDGHIELVCREKLGSGENTRLVCEVLAGGLLTSRKGINLPDTELSLPALTEHDRRCADFAVANGFNYLALSFVRSPDDVLCLREMLREMAGARPVRVISKIEKPQALERIEAIVDESDGIMVARGDLGVEMDLAEVPVAQRRIIRLCQARGKPVIVATQMLQSMIGAPAPTRAEVSDVATAIFQRADAVMLSGETAVGRWPVHAARMMRRVAERTNAHLQTEPVEFTYPALEGHAGFQVEALAHGVGTIVRDLNAKMVVMWAEADGSARFLSQNRLTRPIVAFSDDDEALRTLSLLYGITPVCLEQPGSANDFIARVDALLLDRQWAERGDAVVVVFGEPLGQVDTTNNVRIHYIGQSDVRSVG